MAPAPAEEASKRPAAKKPQNLPSPGGEGVSRRLTDEGKKRTPTSSDRSAASFSSRRSQEKAPAPKRPAPPKSDMDFDLEDILAEFRND